jgi:hypothetical protein
MYTILFIICMIVTTAIAHLSAYKWVVFTGPKVGVERERVRLVVAVLKRINENWALGRRPYRGVVVVARAILGSGSGAAGVTILFRCLIKPYGQKGTIEDRQVFL